MYIIRDVRDSIRLMWESVFTTFFFSKITSINVLKIDNIMVTVFKILLVRIL